MPHLKGPSYSELHVNCAPCRPSTMSTFLDFFCWRKNFENRSIFGDCCGQEREECHFLTHELSKRRVKRRKSRETHVT